MTWTQYMIIVGIFLAIFGGSIFLLLHLFMLHFFKFSLFGLADEEPAATVADEKAVHTAAVTAALLDAGRDVQAHTPRVCPYRPGTRAADLWRSSYDRVRADIHALHADAAA